MNSSGIKRGLATTAVTALAVAGIPFIASSASASDTALTVANVGPVRDGNSNGGTVVFSVPENTVVNNAQVKLIRTDLTGAAGNQNTPSQTVTKAGAVSPTAEGSEKYGSKTTTDEFSVQIAVDTNPTGATAEFAVFIDSNDNNAVDANELRTPVSITTAGAPAAVEISPDSQTTATGMTNAKDYTVTVKDSSGKVTQLVAGESFTPGGTATVSGTLDETTMNDGVGTVSAYSATDGTKTVTVTGAGAIANTVKDSADLIVIAQADIDEDEFDLVTGADTWDSATNSFGDTVQVRVDQGAVTFEFMSKDNVLPAGADDANKVVLLTVKSADVKFGGKAEQTYSVVLDADGKGSLTVNPTGVVAGAEFTFESPSMAGGPTTVEYARAEADSVKPDASVYVTKVGGTTQVVVSVVDQFGNPIGSPAQVQLVRSGRAANAGSTGRVTVGADGKATFNLADAGTSAGTESFSINLFADQFDGAGNAGNPFAGGTINYTADGLGGDFALNDVSTGTIVPLTDTDANAAAEFKTLNITGGTANAPATISVDNGALVLTGTDTALSKGAASKQITLDGAGDGSVKIVGTTTGLVTVTVTSAGRTKTETLTVKQDATTVAATARNVELEGPESAEAGDVATYTATVTDAFGNPVPGVVAGDLTFTVSGPGNLQNKETVTDADGELEQTVLLTDNANSDITVTVTGQNGQFGSKADEINGAAAKGLTASQKTDSVTSDVVNMAELEQAVEDAEEALAEAQAELAVAQGNLDVAAAELAVAQANVDSLTAKKQKLRQKLNKAKAKGNKQKAKTTRKKLRNTKRSLRAAQDELTIATTKVDAAQSIVEIREGDVADAEADLAEAQQNLEDAQNG